MLKIKRTSQLVARDVPYIMHPKKAIQTLRHQHGVSDHRDFASSHLHEQFKTHSIEFPYVRANDIEEGRVTVILNVAQHYAVDSKGTVRNFLPSMLEFKVRHLLGQPRKENIRQEQDYFAEVKALLEDQYPIPLEPAKVVEKPKIAPEAKGFVNQSPNAKSLRGAQESAQDYWEAAADSAVEEGGVLGFPKYAGSKVMGALAGVGHGVIQSVDALVHNPEESLSGISKGIANFGPEAFNLATDGVKTAADGYSLLSDSVLGTDTETFRNSVPYKIDPIFELNEAEIGANLITSAGVGAVTKLSKVGSASKLGDRIEEQAKNNAMKYEALDDGHSIARHGPEVSDADLIRRVETGIASDDVFSPTPASTRFNSYQEWERTRDDALSEISRRNSVDLSKAPEHDEPTRYSEVVDHGRAIDDGYVGVKSTAVKVGDIATQKVGKVYPDYTEVEGITRTTTTVTWNKSKGRWDVVQHYPSAKNWNQSTKSYDD